MRWQVLKLSHSSDKWKDATWHLQSSFLKIYTITYKNKYFYSFYKTGGRAYVLPQKSSFLFWARSSIWDASELDAAERAEIWDSLSSVGESNKGKNKHKD